MKVWVCDFCMATQEQVRVLIAGPKEAAICEACVIEAAKGVIKALSKSTASSVGVVGKGSENG